MNNVTVPIHNFLLKFISFSFFFKFKTDVKNPLFLTNAVIIVLTADLASFCALP